MKVRRRTAGANIATHTTSDYWKRALYVGPSLEVKGNIRAAVSTDGALHIIVTSEFKGVSDGGDVNPYQQVASGLEGMLATRTTTSSAAAVQKTQAITTKHHEEEIPTAGQEAPRGPDTIGGEILPPPDPPPCTAASSQLGATESIVPTTVHRMTLRSKASNRQRISAGAEHSAAKEHLLDTAMYAEWTTHSDQQYYYAFNTRQIIHFDDDRANISPSSDQDDARWHEPAHFLLAAQEEAFRAVTKDVPKSFAAALQDPKWGDDPARLEWATLLLEAQTLVAVDRADALEAVGTGADLVVLRSFPSTKRR